MRVLVTGGAGYVGCVLVPELLRAGHQVRVLDSLMYGGRGLLPWFSSPGFEFVRGDVRSEGDVANALEGADAAIHLAGIVGYPACKRDPVLAREVNYESAVLLERVRKKDLPIVFASTGSNYGAVVGDVCTEETPLSPLTIYGTTKTDAERHLLAAGNAVCYRFATAFGVSNRLRLDLLINDFCYQAVKVKNLIIYERTYKRTFIHVIDMARAFMFALENAKTRDEVFNVGDESMNYDKEQIALKIKDRIPYYLHFADVGKDEDQRNYEVSYEKIRRLGFKTMITVDQGIDEIVRALHAIDVHNEFSNV